MRKFLENVERLLTVRTQPLAQAVPKRIAYVVTQGISFASNGYAIRTHGIAKGLISNGFEPICIVRPGMPWDLDKSRRIEKEVTVDSVRYVHSSWDLGHRPKDDFDFLNEVTSKFLALFRVYRPSIVLAASNHQIALPALLAARKLGLPFYYEVRGFWELSRCAKEPDFRESDLFAQEAERETFVAAHADAVFTITRQMRDLLAQRGVPRDNIYLWPNGVSGDLVKHQGSRETTSTRQSIRDRFGIGPDEFVVGYVGSITAYDGIEALETACEHLARSGHPIRLLIVGDESPVIPQQRSEWLQTNATVIRTGRVPQEELPDYYNAIDLVCLPRKPLEVCQIVAPIKPYEAVLYGKPLLLSDVAPLRDIAHHLNASLFRADDLDDLKRNLVRMLADQRQPSRQSINWISKHRTFDSIVGATLALFERHNSAKPAVQISEQDWPSISALSALDPVTEQSLKHEIKTFQIVPGKHPEQVSTSNAKFALLDTSELLKPSNWICPTRQDGQDTETSLSVDVLPEIVSAIANRMPVVIWDSQGHAADDRLSPIIDKADVLLTSASLSASQREEIAERSAIETIFPAISPRIFNPVDRPVQSSSVSICVTGHLSSENSNHQEFVRSHLKTLAFHKATVWSRSHETLQEFKRLAGKLKGLTFQQIPFNNSAQVYRRHQLCIVFGLEKEHDACRQALESLACGTPAVIVSPDALRYRNIPDCVHLLSEPDQVGNWISSLTTDTVAWERTSHQAYRQVMQAHTYKQRLHSMFDALEWSAVGDSSERVSIIVQLERSELANRVIDNITRQKHQQIELLICHTEQLRQTASAILATLQTQAPNIKSTHLIEHEAGASLWQLMPRIAETAQGAFLSCMTDQSYYFEDYISDLLIPFSFGNYAATGKVESFRLYEPTSQLCRVGLHSCMRGQSALNEDAFVIKMAALRSVLQERQGIDNGKTFWETLDKLKFKMIASDPFNACQYNTDSRSPVKGASGPSKDRHSRPVSTGLDITHFVF